MGSEPPAVGSDFALALLRAAVMLTGLADDLVDEIPSHAFPGENPAAVFVEQLSGTIATAMAEADPRDVRRATELIEAACERVIEHLRLALELSQRMHDNSEGGSGRAYG